MPQAQRIQNSDVTISKLNGQSAMITPEALAALRAALGGQVFLPGEPGYDQSRTVWNATVDKRPGLVVRCQGTSDVIQAMRFSRQHELLVAVRSGGHNIAGKAVADGAVLIDLSQMRSVRVDPAAKVAWVEPGATLGDFDRETQVFCLTTPTGINSTTGIAGLTLGGGFGWTTRKFGMTIDSLISADVVTANGEILHTSEKQNADLFWAIRGGGGNFGIVTGFEFRLQTLGPLVLSGLLVHPFVDAPKLLSEYRSFVAQAPDELSVWLVMRKAPPLPFLPEQWHGKEVLIMAVCYAGDPSEGEKILAPLRKLGKPIADVIGLNPFAGWQQGFDALLTPGARNYWKSHDFSELDDGLLAKLTDFAGRLPTNECEIFIASVGGAMGRVPSGATAFGGRSAKFVMNVHTRWQNVKDDKRCIAWAREFYDATKPFASGTAYVNFLSEEDGDRLSSTYGVNYERLCAVKRKYDPENIFRVNQNIKP
jgi:FAD/FMN-containing dehydrogenase